MFGLDQTVWFGPELSSPCRCTGTGRPFMAEASVGHKSSRSPYDFQLKTDFGNMDTKAKVCKPMSKVQKSIYINTFIH